MNQPTNSAWSDMVKPLRARYLVDLASRQSLLISFLHAAELGRLSEKDREQIIAIAHKLAGSGATYGFESISRCARVLEYHLVDEPDLPEASIITDLRSLLDECDLAAQEESDDGEQSATADSSAADPVAASAEPLPPKAPEQNELPLILVVDDDESIRLLLHGLIHDRARIIDADNAANALSLMYDRRPDLVLLDDKMPGELSGMAMLEQIQGMSEFQNIPVIMITGSDKPEAVMRGLMAGAVDYIVKPFDTGIVRTKLNQRLQSLTKTVLIVDDDQNIRDLLAHKFRSVGCHILLAETGQKALEIINASPPNLVLLDRMMPELDGLTLLQMMRSNPKTEKTPVILLTAKRREEDILEGFDVGATDYVVKPFNPDEVVARCTRLLDAQTESAA